MRWKTVKIGECVEKVRTCSPSTTFHTELFDYVDISSVDNKSKRIVNVTKIAGVEAPSRARQLLKENDVLVSTVRPNLNAVATVSNDLDGAVASTGYCVLRAKSDLLNSDYLFYWVQSKNFVDDMVKQATGASYPAISDTIVKDSKIPLPPLSIQNQIADILDKADLLRQKDQQLLQKYDELAQSIFYEMFGDPIRNERGWMSGTVAEVIDGITAGTSLGGEDRGRDENEIAVLKISAVTSGIFKPEEYKVPEQSSLPKEVITPKKRDLLFSRANTRELVGATAVVDMDYPWLMLPDKLWKLHLRPGISPYFMRFLLWDKGVRNELTKTATGTSGSMLNISMSKLKALNIPIPDEHVQTLFEKRVMQIQDAVRACELGGSKSEFLFNNLITQYFS